MKRAILFLIAFIVAPMVSAAIVITAEGGDNAELLLSYACTGTEVIRGVSLIFTVEDAELTDVYDVIVEETAFNAYIDYYISYPDFLTGLPDETYLPGEGAHPVTNPSVPGVLETMPASYFGITIGVVDPTGNNYGVTGSGPLLTIHFGNYADLDYCVTIEEDPLRGGIVGDDITSVMLPDQICITVPEPAAIALLALGALLIRKWKKAG